MIYVQLLVLCVVIFAIWIILSNFRDIQEPMRTIPRPNPNYNPNQYIEMSGNIINNDKIDVNAEIDVFIDKYFGRKNIPTNYCIGAYYQYFVNQGNVSIENKTRLKDVCYYILQFVIPSIPSEINPTPTINWPYIEFLSNSLKPFTIETTQSFSPFVMYQVNPYKYNNLKVNGGDGFGAAGYDKNGGKFANDGNSNSNSSNSNNSGKNSNGGNSGSCGCPTACFSNLLKNLNDSSYNNSNSSSSSSSNAGNSGSSDGSSAKGTSINTPGGYTMNNFLADQSLFSNTNKNPVSELTITNEPQTVTPGTLDQGITDFINNYFGIDPSSNVGKPQDDIEMPSLFLPKNFGKMEFTDFFAARTLIDQEHKTKLYDMIYYFMDNIILGLPTENVPFSYVEWKPIVWSSVSYV
jgi:hypothetical protein